MAQFEITPIKVCVVCIHIVANGEYNDGTDAAEKCAEGQNKAWNGDEKYFIPGSTCEEDPCPRHEDSMDCTDLEQGFSWSDCEGCGCRLGGDRFLAYVMIPK